MIERQKTKAELKTDLQNRLNFLNMFESYLNEYHAPITLEILQAININFYPSNVKNWLIENNKRIDEIFQYLKKYGSNWQKHRCGIVERKIKC